MLSLSSTTRSLSRSFSSSLSTLSNSSSSSLFSLTSSTAPIFRQHKGHDHYHHHTHQHHIVFMAKRHFIADPLLISSGVVIGCSAWFFTRWSAYRNALSNEFFGDIYNTSLGPIQYMISSPPASSVTTGSNKSEPSSTASMILFFHDCPGGSDQYPALCSTVPDFSLDVPVVSVGRPGTLKSTITRHINFEEMTQIYKEILTDAVKIGQSQRVHLLSIGKGSIYALHFAATLPHMTQSLIMMSPQTRKDALKTPSVAGTQRSFSGTELRGVLTMMLKRPKFIPDLVDFLNYGGVKNLERRTLQNVLLREFTNETGKLLVPGVADCIQTSRANHISQGKKLIPLEHCLLRANGHEHMSLKQMGAVNDLCNACGVVADFSIINFSSYKSNGVQNDFFKNLKEKFADAQRAHELRSKGFEWKNPFETGDAKDKEKSSSNEVSPKEDGKVAGWDSGDGLCYEIQTDNQDILKSISCPTLILHSPQNGLMAYDFHALHGKEHIPNVELQSMEGYPHTIPLKDPAKVKNIVMTFINKNSKKAIEESKKSGRLPRS